VLKRIRRSCVTVVVLIIRISCSSYRRAATATTAVEYTQARTHARTHERMRVAAAAVCANAFGCLRTEAPLRALPRAARKAAVLHANRAQ
jgi:hypothetical protein